MNKLQKIINNRRQKVIKSFEQIDKESVDEFWSRKPLPLLSGRVKEYIKKKVSFVNKGE